ncbi:Branched-chain amino acid transport system substrate-binding protein OS=Castellaniella defragrans OX=75697 GN=HNR28_001882 PE=3 SV=1 [Castellaniella defragrans]
MNRRKFITRSTQMGALLAFPALATRSFAAEGPIRIGFLSPLTGTAAAPGKEMQDGWNLFWKQHGLKIAGRDVKIYVEDDGSNPDTSLQKARRLVEQQKVDLLIGDILANTGLAVAEYAKTSGVPYLMPAVADDELTQRGRIPNVLRTGGFSASQITRPLADWCLKQGYRRVATLAQDYSFGYQQTGGFVQVFTAGGGAVAGQLWHPLGTPDLSPYLGQIQAMKPDVVFTVQTGADAARLLKQWTDFGLNGQIPLAVSQNVTDQSVIRNLRPDECLGVVSSSHYAEGLDNKSTQDFVHTYEEAYKIIPGIFAAEGFTGALWLADALEHIKGDAEDRKKLIHTLITEKITGSPLGKTLSLDAYGNPVFDVYIRKVAKRADGKLVNDVIATYPNVSQFWTYNPETYLKEPPFTRTYQGIKKS